MRIVKSIVRKICSSASVIGVRNVAALLVVCAGSALCAGNASAQSILVGNFLPNPDMETETRFVPHRTEGPTDNSFADYWHHSQYSGWNDLTPPAPPLLPGPTDTVLSGLHSLRLYDQASYYFAPGNPGAGEFTQEEFRTFATAIPLDASSPTGRAEKLWVRWHWNYEIATGFVPEVTMNFRTSTAPVLSLDLVGVIFEHKTIADDTSNGLWEEVTVEVDIYPGPNGDGVGGERSFDIIFLTEGGKDSLGVMYVDDVSVSAIDPDALLAGDFDGDGDVDGKDFLSWQRGVSPTPFSAGDLATWQGAYGSPLMAATAVPELATGTTLLLGIGVAWGMCRTRYGGGRSSI